MPSTAHQVKEQLKKSYNTIASDFSKSRYTVWPEFTLFDSWIPDDCKLLDIGCGNGRFYDYLKERKEGLDYVGIDFSEELIGIASKRFPKQEFSVQDMTQLDLNKRFDRIACIAAFHHLPSKKMRKTALKKMFEHMEDDGILLLSVWNLWQKRFLSLHFKAFFKWLFSGLRYDRRGLMVPFGKTKVPRYYHAFRRYELEKLLRDSGFHIEHFEISQHNYVYVCSKSMLKAQSRPAFADKKMEKLIQASPAATCKSC